MVLCRRLLGIGPNPFTKDAELIAFRVGEYHPRRVTLPDIGPPSTEGKETFDFCGLIDRTEVRMESVLACLLLRNRHEQQARHPIRSRPDLELVRGVAHDNPSQGLGPPSTKRDRIVSVDDDLLPNEIHVANSARSVSQADRLAGQARPSGAQERQDRTVSRKSPEPPDHAPALDDDLAGGLRADLWVGSLPPALDDAGAIGGALRRHLRGPATAHRSRPAGLATPRALHCACRISRPACSPENQTPCAVPTTIGWMG